MEYIRANTFKEYGTSMQMYKHDSGKIAVRFYDEDSKSTIITTLYPSLEKANKSYDLEVEAHS